MRTVLMKLIANVVIMFEDRASRALALLIYTFQFYLYTKNREVVYKITIISREVKIHLVIIVRIFIFYSEKHKKKLTLFIRNDGARQTIGM